MKRLAARIQRVRNDLLVIQQELSSGAAWERSRAEAHPPTTPEVDLTTLQALKGSLDEARHFVWWLLQEIALGPVHLADESLQTVRLHRAAEMLRSLRAQMEHTTGTTRGEAHSFFDTLQSLATVVVDRHMSEAPREAVSAEEIKSK